MVLCTLSHETMTFPNCFLFPSFCLDNNKEFNLANVLFGGSFLFSRFYFTLVFSLLPSLGPFISLLLLSGTISVSRYSFFFLLPFFFVGAVAIYIWTLSVGLRIGQARALRSQAVKEMPKIRRNFMVTWLRLFYFADFPIFSGCSVRWL